MIRQALIQNFGYTHYVLTRNLEGVSHEEAVRTPPGGGNCLNWVLGHILASRNNVLRLVGEPPILADHEAAGYRRGSHAESDPDRTVDTQRLLADLERSQERLLRSLAKLSDADLAVPVPNLLSGTASTVGLELSALQFHEAYHSGQTGTLRRIAGKKGAIA